MKNYFKSKFVLFLFLLVIIIGGIFYFNPIKVEAMCNQKPTTWPYHITTPGGTCWFSCEGELTPPGAAGCTCNSGYYFDPDSESCINNPPTPTNLIATPSCETGTIDVLWNVSSGATSYTLRDGVVAIYTGIFTHYSHTGLIVDSSHSYTVRANGASGSSAYSSPAVIATAPAESAGCTSVMFGTLTSANCTIISGLGSCNTTVNWTTINPVAISSVTSSYPSANTIVATGNSGSQSVAVPYSSRNFYLYNNNQLLAQSTATASCADGNSWNGSMCIPDAMGPDLTAGAPTPNTPIKIGVNRAYTSVISNIGNETTGASFSVFFQKATLANGGGVITDLAPSSMSTLDAGGTTTATSPSFSFALPGTRSVRACADKTSSAGGGVIAESDEDNNCSSWTNVEVLMNCVANQGNSCSLTNTCGQSDDTGLIGCDGNCYGTPPPNTCDVCTNGAINSSYPACNICPSPLIYKESVNRCVKKPIFIEI